MRINSNVSALPMSSEETSGTAGRLTKQGLLREIKEKKKKKTP